MTAMPMEKQREIISMTTVASAIMNGNRISQIDFIPSGSEMAEVDQCEFISYDFLARQKPVECLMEKGNIIFSCESGSFSFGINCPGEHLEKVARLISQEGFIFAKRSYGFSLIA